MVIGAPRRHLRDASALVGNRDGRPREGGNERAGARAERRANPCSTSWRTAALVSALVCDAMRKIVSAVILPVGFAVGPAERLLVDDLAVLHHEGDDSRHAAGIDILLQRLDR